MARLARWQQQAKGAPGVVVYHKDMDYLLRRLGVPLLGTIEPVPGIPPTAGHLKDLISRLQNRQGVVLYHPYEPADGPHKVATALGWKAVALPLESPLNTAAEGYVELIDQYVQALKVP
jgi:zinc/manganese transport system substrate-binding protein